MAAQASDPVGNVTEMYLLSNDQLGETYQTRITGTKCMVKPSATYEQVDTALRGLANLSTNTYNDTILITSISVNDIIAM